MTGRAPSLRIHLSGPVPGVHDPGEVATDYELLREYVESGSEPAFTALVNRHAGTVYASALRQTRNPEMAEEVTQAVFILLARKAATFNSRVILGGWLFRAAHFAARDLAKSEHRRQRRETAAYHMSPEDAVPPVEPVDESLWTRVAPVLDRSLHRLADADRHALLLRFFENRSLAEVGAALGIAEDAARKRVRRALDRLRLLLSRDGLDVGSEALAPLLTRSTAVAPPLHLAAQSVAAALGSAGSSSVPTTLPLVADLATATARHLAWWHWKGWVLGTTLLALTTGGSALALRIARAAPPAGVRSATAGDDYSAAGFPSAEPVHEFIRDLQARVLQADAAGIARGVRFPLRVNHPGGTRWIADEAAFLAGYPDLINRDVASLILKCPRTGLLARDRGVMIGTGEVWLAPADPGAGDVRPRIIALNLP